MPRYQCHKEVVAFEISEIKEKGWDWQLVPKDGQGSIILVDADWYKRHKPQVGGYLVQYADGYTSFSPKQAFEEGYTLIVETLPPPLPGELAELPEDTRDLEP